MDLDARAWRGILQGNGLLSGVVVPGDQNVYRARSQAFSLNEGLAEFGIPSFEVFDDSSIAITEIASEQQAAATNYGLAWDDLEAFWRKSGSTASKKTSTDAAKDELCITYYFPRVVVYLQPQHLLLSKQCKLALRKIEETKDIEDVQRFYADFGHVFSSVIHLGGRLQSVRPRNTIKGSTTAEKQETLSKAATAAFAFGESNGSSLLGNRGNKQTTLSLQDSPSLAWVTRGGDTLLSSNPSLWAPTVRPSKNWRVIQCKDTTSIVDVISEIEAWAHVRELFRSITSSHALPTNTKTEEKEVKEESVSKDASLFRILKEAASRGRQSAEQENQVSELAERMLDAGADVNARGKDGETPLMVALSANLQGVAKIFLDRAADVYATKKDGTTPLHYAGKMPSMVRELIERGAYVNARSEKGTPLHQFAAHGLPECAKILIEGGARVNENGPEGQTPLIDCSHWSFKMHAEDPTRVERMIKLLLSHGASVHVRDKNGFSALRCAVFNRLSPARGVQLLLDAGADPNETHGNKLTPLHVAAAHSLVEAMRFLIEAGADVNADANSTTPLHEAAVNGPTESIRLLVQAGANTEAVEAYFGTPLRMAVTWGKQETVQALLNEGVSIHPRDGHELSILDQARKKQVNVPSMSGIVQILERYA